MVLWPQLESKDGQYRTRVWSERKDTTFIHCRRIVKRKGRPGTFRVHVKYQTKPSQIKFETPTSTFETHVLSFLFSYFVCLFYFAFADSNSAAYVCRKLNPQLRAFIICDDKIYECIFNRNKILSQKHKRGAVWIKKIMLETNIIRLQQILRNVQPSNLLPEYLYA